VSDNNDLISEVDSFLESKKQELLENFTPPEVSEDEIKIANKLLLHLIDPHDMLLMNAVASIEKYFWQISELPSVNIFLDLGITLDEMKEVINPKLRGRGIPEYSFNKIATPVGEIDSGLDPRFVLACNVMCRASGKSKGAKFKDLSTLGVNEPMWNAWLSIPSYFDYAKKLMDVQFESVTDLDAKMGISRNVANGDLQSIKYFHEFTGRFRPADTNSTNLLALITALMEILSRNVEASVLDKISLELENTPVGELMRAS